MIEQRKVDFFKKRSQQQSRKPNDGRKIRPSRTLTSTDPPSSNQTSEAVNSGCLVWGVLGEWGRASIKRH